MLSAWAERQRCCACDVFVSKWFDFRDSNNKHRSPDFRWELYFVFESLFFEALFCCYVFTFCVFMLDIWSSSVSGWRRIFAVCGMCLAMCFCMMFCYSTPSDRPLKSIIQKLSDCRLFSLVRAAWKMCWSFLFSWRIDEVCSACRVILLFLQVCSVKKGISATTWVFDSP